MADKYKTYDDDYCHGKPAPSLETLKFVQGEPTDIVPGKVNVVLFWAKWDKGAGPTVVAVSELSEKYSDVVFVGVSCDAEEGQISRFIEKGEFPVHSDFRLAFDEGKQVNKKYTAALCAPALGIPHLFLVDTSGTIVWHEQFSQTHPISDGDFETQLAKLVAGEDLISNGKRPEDSDDEDSDDDMGEMGDLGDDDDDFSLF
uniref:Thioredoxin domain-containing protein n=1 Tax=Stereomyxa ramosa TaxID=1078864 RepID=A0A7S2AB40_9EUKA|eukprot:CAMPEP_0174250656 /NCGR_PEP_ID=MMETSP0439-20130205/762_1 /TAXON_ID=0 /ORGANISM="Stereomyxa ramosa, Strain Chinc5" /LENGTH=200 /DNA_ID=CAMNT_0015330787 /DNA_START=47 /DNA_END=649 /DNA_ORIENTATION=-